MARLFHEEEVFFHFKIEDGESFDRLVNNLDYTYSAEQLKDYLLEIQPKLAGRCSVSMNGVELNIEDYIPSKKPYQYRKKDAALFCALVHCHPDNLRQVLSLLPSWYSEAVRRMITNGCISQTELSEIGAQSMIVDLSRRYSWDSFKVGKCCSVFGVGSSMCVDSKKRSYWDREGYLFIPRALTRSYALALLPDLCSESHIIQDTTTYHVLPSEESFHQSFPLIQGLQRQQQIPVTEKLKMSSASAKKLRSGIPEVIPQSLRETHKFNSGQYFLPGLLWALQKSRKGTAEYVKAALSRLVHAGPEQIYPAFLPHLKGFRANQFRYVADIFWMEILCAFLEEYSVSWLSLPGLSDRLHIYGDGYSISMNLLGALFLENTITGKVIRPDTQGREIDLEVLRAMALCLYGWGMADLAVDDSLECPDTPLGAVMQVRLTPFGRFILGLDKTYSPPVSKADGNFILDTERLIIHSSGENNPYERLLMDTSDPIGCGKYRMSAESFLRHCKSTKDVEEKVKFFEDYIDGNPPEIWKEFFASIRRRCNPLDKVREDYCLLKLNPKDAELVELMTSNPAIRKLIILAEGYLFLVRKKDYATLVQLLKQHSYLL